MVKQLHIVKQGEKNWVVKQAGNPAALFDNCPTQESARTLAGIYAKVIDGAEVVTHRPDGRIRAADTIGKPDPFPPRG